VRLPLVSTVLWSRGGSTTQTAALPHVPHTLPQLLHPNEGIVMAQSVGAVSLDHDSRCLEHYGEVAGDVAGQDVSPVQCDSLGVRRVIAS